MKLFLRFVLGCVRLVLRGNSYYWTWIAFLGVCILIGVWGYSEQLSRGLIETNMRDQVSWGFYISNFTFLVGVAAAAVVLVIPAYVYQWKPIKEIVIIGELLAVSAIVMCILFVTFDIGRPDRVWHLAPFIGNLNFPSSLLSWDVLVLSLYGLLNFVIVTHIVFRGFQKREYSKSFATPLILLSIPAAISIHTVTAFLYNGLPSRPFWNSAILAPRFLASAFCSGPAIILVLLQLLKHYKLLEIRKEAIEKVAELMAYAMFINLFLFGAEIFREFYSGTQHVHFFEYLFVGHGSDKALVPFAWTAVTFSSTAFIIFLVPSLRRNPTTLNIGIFLIYFGVYIEKGMALVVPGFTPSTLGEIYVYTPSRVEIMVAIGVFGVGFLVFTFLLKVAIATINQQFNVDSPLAQVGRPQQEERDAAAPA
jgi:molybdopterin-containing oxidoreductase family membrane subunit